MSTKHIFTNTVYLSKELFRDIDIWFDEQDMTQYKQPMLVRSVPSTTSINEANKLIQEGFTLVSKLPATGPFVDFAKTPTYTFEDENYALLFKLTWGDHFIHTVIEDDKE